MTESPWWYKSNCRAGRLNLNTDETEPSLVTSHHKKLASQIRTASWTTDIVRPRSSASLCFPVLRTPPTISHAEADVLWNRWAMAPPSISVRQKSPVSWYSLCVANAMSFAMSHIVVTRRIRCRSVWPQSRVNSWRFLSAEPDIRLPVTLWR